MPKLSIIVAVHNQLGHNQLFLEGIQRYTTGPYKVIVVDNHSTDGSAEFSEANGCQMILKRWLLVSLSQIVEDAAGSSTNWEAGLSLKVEFRRDHCLDFFHSSLCGDHQESGT